MRRVRPSPHSAESCLTGSSECHQWVAGRAVRADRPFDPRVSSGPSPQGLAVGGAVFVVAQAELVVGEEHLADQVAAAPHSGLVEDVLEVLPDGMGRDHWALADLGGRVALQHQPGDLLLAFGQPIDRYQQRRTGTGWQGKRDPDRLVSAVRVHGVLSIGRR
jgi:hypothetical protein